MDILSVDFIMALLIIIMIDLMLAGDNAIVIALAARNLPKQYQRRAILWGTVGAILIRSVATVLVVWLLKIPGLLIIGGILLLWIAYRLLVQPHSKALHKGSNNRSLWGAIRTIIIADAVMGLDNVLAVAGAAHGSWLLVVLGLLISIPIIIYGSTLFIHLLDRFPWLLYLGAAILVFTAGKMMSHEPIFGIEAYFSDHKLISYLLIVTLMGLIVGAGYKHNLKRKEVGSNEVVGDRSTCS